MNLKIDKELAPPPSLNHPYLLTALPSPYSSLLLYSPPLPPPKAEETNKKKFAFKAKEPPQSTTEPIYLFESSERAWKT